MALTAVATPTTSTPGIVTPEAVVVRLERAGLASRALARAVDVAIALAIILLVALLAAAVLGPAADAELVFVLAGFTGVFVYPALAEGIWRGRTIGKVSLGLRVVTVEGAPIGFRHAAIRSALQVVDFVLVPIGVVAVLSAMANRSDQRLGDRLAGTIVVRTAGVATGARAIAFPPLPGFEGYVASLDVTAVTPEQYEVLRSFLTRVGELSPAARAGLADRLARGVLTAMRHTPPPGMHLEHVLASVAAAYQRRHGGPATWATWSPGWTGQGWPSPGPAAPVPLPSSPPMPTAPPPPPPAGWSPPGAP